MSNAYSKEISQIWVIEDDIEALFLIVKICCDIRLIHVDNLMVKNGDSLMYCIISKLMVDKNSRFQISSMRLN